MFTPHGEGVDRMVDATSSRVGASRQGERTLHRVAKLEQEDGDKFWRMPECYIRGNTIKYLRVPDEGTLSARHWIPNLEDPDGGNVVKAKDIKL